MNNNDKRIMKLKETINEKRAELESKPTTFYPITNCMLVLDDVQYNLRVASDELLLIKLNVLRMSALDLKVNPDEFIICGFPLNSWISDVKRYLEVKHNKEELSKLAGLEKQLNLLLSDDKKTELQVDKLEKTLYLDF